jgi:aminoglycoside phosphotransferase (APT) family kinase protein
VDFSDLTPLAGGWSGQTFVAEAGAERTVVRIYPPGGRPEAAPEIDAAVLRLVRGLVPVPDVLEVRRGAPAADQPGLLVTTFLPGVRGDLVLPSLDDDAAAALGRRMGGLVADLAGMPTLRFGPFVDPELTIGDFGLADGLPGFVTAQADALGWDQGLVERLDAVAVDAQAMLDGAGRTCLVHSDANPKNVLIDPETLSVTGLLDWEFAHSGHPFTDLGNLLRFDRTPTPCWWCGVSDVGGRPRRHWSSPGPPTFGLWSTLRHGVARIPLRIEPTSTSRPSLGQEICTRCRSERNAHTPMSGRVV